MHISIAQSYVWCTGYQKHVELAPIIASIHPDPDHPNPRTSNLCSHDL